MQGGRTRLRVEMLGLNGTFCHGTKDQSRDGRVMYASPTVAVTCYKGAIITYVVSKAGSECLYLYCVGCWVRGPVLSDGRVACCKYR